MAEEFDRDRIKQIEENCKYMLYFKAGLSVVGLVSLSLDSWHVEKLTYFVFSLLMHQLFVHLINQHKDYSSLYAPACLLTFCQFGLNCSPIYQADHSLLMMAYLAISFYSGICLSLKWITTSIAQAFSCLLLICFNLAILDSKQQALLKIAPALIGSTAMAIFATY